LQLAGMGRHVQYCAIPDGLGEFSGSLEGVGQAVPLQGKIIQLPYLSTRFPRGMPTFPGLGMQQEAGPLAVYRPEHGANYVT
jgi:hypothetical protein